MDERPMDELYNKETKTKVGQTSKKWRKTDKQKDNNLNLTA